jgi:signal transduction histidine kinase
VYAVAVVHAVTRYAVAVASVGVAIALTIALPDLLAPMRFFFLWVAVLLTAVVAGTGPALTAAALSVIAAAILIFAPLGVPMVGAAKDAIRLALFASFATALGVAVGMRRTAQQRAHALNARLLEEASERKRLQEAAEAANRAKDEFLTTLSHELRTPLTAISGWAHMLEAGIADEATQKVAIGTIVQSAKAQAELIDDLLDISRVVAGTLQLRVAAVDLGRVVQEVVLAAKPAADAKSISLELVTPSQPVTVRGDDRRFRQIVWNLVTNAVKFTGRDGSVRVTLSVAVPQARIEVSDNGRGIEPAFLPYVWDRFRQGDSSTSREYGGLGLGLSVVRHLVEMHGGSVAVESAGPGRGATFRVDLPLAPAGSAPSPAGPDELVETAARLS